MITNIEISTLLNHFLSDNGKDAQNIDKNAQNKYKTKIINHCFYSVNEANISEIIKEIPYYSKTYLIIENYEFIDIRQLNDAVLEKLRRWKAGEKLITDLQTEKEIFPSLSTYS